MPQSIQARLQDHPIRLTTCSKLTQVAFQKIKKVALTCLKHVVATIAALYGFSTGLVFGTALVAGGTLAGLACLALAMGQLWASCIAKGTMARYRYAIDVFETSV
jgi:hypothetical protein